MNSGRESAPNQNASWRDQLARRCCRNPAEQETAMGTFNNNRKVPGFGLRGVLAEFARLFRSIVDPYRPELHYMRGPGPKWHAKHGATRAEAPDLQGLAPIKH
jgi:hypothetical protein